MTDKILNCLRKSDLFREMPSHLLDSLASIAIERKFGSSETLFFQNQPASGFYLIESGQIKIYRMSNDGREQVIHLFGRGEIFGEVPVFQGAAYPAFAQATKNSTVYYFSRDEFLKLGKRQPEILLSLLAILSLRLRNFVELIDDFSLKDVNARLAKYLCKHCDGCEKRIVKLEISKSNLAASLGTIPATLSRTFKKLQDSGAIKVSGNQIAILDCETLKSLGRGEKPD